MTTTQIRIAPVNGVETSALVWPAIVDETVRLCTQVYKPHLRAVVLTGSVARDEGTAVTQGRTHVVLGDAEFFVVFHDRYVLPTDTDLAVLVGKVEERLRRRNIVARVSLDGVHARYFRGVRPSIFGYELRECGRVCWGDPDILRLIPAFTVADIPREDAWRLLANRLVEQLEGFEELAGAESALSSALYYRTVKLYLDMATSLLVFAGGYAPTYAERARALALLGPPARLAWPFAMESFAEDVTTLTEWKLNGASAPTDVPRAFWERAVERAEQLWYWELAQLTDLPSGRPGADLLHAWIRRQPLSARLRGWAHVARRGGRSAIHRWPQWLQTAVMCSPRYAVYAVAAPMVFELRRASVARQHPDLASFGSRQGELPFAIPHACPDAADVKAVVAAVLDNYRQFLVGTRA